ncbi:uncharacterized protein LOC122808105 [Protopterus annectens]|uniref:uncharacterized protein LOC122808105 n=1 Tax=Protopterus annectens TaxID=7888 RepID=UPI001CFBF12B|nr:uncharacterized protein LOC122808105 [Protopterus annectens]
MSLIFFGWQVFSDDKKHLKSGQQPKRGHGYTMYHGTHKSNAKAIITSGFRPSSGGTLGAGVYCSRDINKASSYPAFCSTNDRVILQLNVRVGKVKKIDQGSPLQLMWHQNGYDTAWLPPVNGMWEEDCVWDPKRITVVGIAHCTDSSLKTELEKLIKQNGKSHPKENCQLCGKGNHMPHPILKCGGCSKVICPFINRHVCKRRN